jgi:hypothetical protein
MIILPSQARDKHGESTQKTDVAFSFLAVTALGLFLQHGKERRLEAKEDERVARESALQRLVEAGVEVEAAQAALRDSGWDADAAVRQLLGGSGDDGHSGTLQ